MPEITLRDPLTAATEELWSDWPNWPVMPRRWLRRALRNAELLGEAAPLDISKHNGDLVIRMSLPGFAANEISCEVKDDFVTVKAEHEETAEEKAEEYYSRERRVGEIARSFSLPQAVDAERADATYRNGVLEVRVPVKHEEATKRVTIKTE
ncbi:MAG: Hsp20/alpha crystallin family protein [Dehalococcoidia bacterium]